MKLHLWPKHYNNTQNRASPVSYTSSPFSPYLGALELQFALGPFYTFVSIYLMVLYQFKSIDLDDYNLIYSQNKNRGFTKFLTAFPLKPIQPIQNQSRQYKTTSNPSSRNYIKNPRTMEIHIKVQKSNNPYQKA